MVSESNKHMIRLIISNVPFLFKMSNTHDQIHYSNNVSNPGGHIQKRSQFKYIAYKNGTRHGVKYIGI